MRAFVTGSTGLLGHSLVRELERVGHRVSGLVRSEEKARRLLPDSGMELVRGDMRDVPGFADAMHACDAVFHTAAYFRESFQPGDHWTELEAINIKGTLTLLAEADRRGVKSFVHVSSSGTVGMKSDGSPGDETTPPDPVMLRTQYYRAKVEGDRAIAAFSPVHGMRVVRVHPGWMWGPGDAAPTTAGQFVLDYLARRIPAVIDGGAMVVDARDVAAAMVVSAERAAHGASYLLGGTYYSVADILTTLERVTGVQAPQRRIPHTLMMTAAWLSEVVGRLSGRPVLITRDGVRSLHAKIRVSCDNAVRDLSARFRPFEETARDTVAWLEQHRGWFSPPA